MPVYPGILTLIISSIKPMHVAIIGAGISGLAAAYRLHAAGHAVQVFEADAQPGGVIRTVEQNGFLIEEGPNSINGANPTLTRVMQTVNLLDQKVEANPDARNRFVVRDGGPVPIPRSPAQALRTPLLSTRAKLRLLTEPLRPPGPSNESLSDFVQRRLGTEVLDYAVNPFVAGVYGGRPDQLAVQHAFPMLKTLEKKHGSLLIGGLRSALGSSAPSDAPTVDGLFSFRNGLATLPKAIAASFRERISLSCPVHACVPTQSGWRVEHEQGTSQADAVVFAAPLHQLGTDIVLDTPLGIAPLQHLPYAPMRSVSLGVPRDAITHPLDGFGMLVPAKESDFRILGTIFASTLFPGRAPDGHVLLTTFVGGARAPHLVEQPRDEVEHLVRNDLRTLLGLQGDPVMVHHVVWPRAIPQYTAQHGRVQGRLDALEAAHPGLYFAGNYRSGISVKDAFASGWHTAGALMA